jgi:bla regulator protein BlaR1
MNPPTLDSLSHWLLRTSLEASLLIVAILAVRWALGKRLTPAWRIGLWAVVGLKLLLPAFVPAGFGLGQWWQASGKADVIAAIEREAPAAAVAVEMPAATVPQVEVEMAAPKRGVPWTHVLLGVWMAGALTVAGLAIARQWRFSRSLRARPCGDDPRLRRMLDRLKRLAGVRATVPVVMMPPGTTPAVAGCVRARLLLPEDWATRFDDNALRHILLHELLHVRHRDLLWNWAALCVQAIHWFNPLVWLVVARFQADRELRCDAGAVALLEPQERLAYGHTLLRVQQSFFAPPAVAGLAPCVRNHPTLRQRILMIAEPNRNRPWLQALFAAAFGVITCYAFTTAGAAEEEKDLPPKERTRETNRGARDSEREGDGPRKERDGADGKMKEGERKDGERAREGDKPRTGERDGDKPRTGERDGDKPRTGERDGDKPRTGERDGDKPRTGERDGDKPRTGERDGDKPRTSERDGDKPRTGERDGDKPRTGERDGDKPRTGERDGDKPRTGERDGDKPRTGARDGEGVKTGARDGEKKPGARDGEGGRSREGAPVKTAAADGTGTSLVLRVTDAGAAVRVGEEVVPMNRLRGFLQGFLPQHAGAKVIVTGDPDVPYKSLTGTVDAVRDNGHKSVTIQAQ